MYSRRYHDATNLTCARHRRPLTQETPALVYTWGRMITHLFFSQTLLMMLPITPAGLLVTAAAGRGGLASATHHRSSRSSRRTRNSRSSSRSSNNSSENTEPAVAATSKGGGSGGNNKASSDWWRGENRMLTIFQLFVVTTPILLAMHAAKKMRSWLGQTYGYGVELYIEDCLRVQGGRLAVYKEAETHSARQIPDSPSGAISSQDGGLLIRLGFEVDSAAGAFIGKVRTWCEFHELTLRVSERTEAMIRLGQYIAVAQYVAAETTSPPNAQARSRSRSSEASFATYVTEILDDKDAQCVYQSFEVEDPLNQKDSCHLVSHSVCKKTPLDKDDSNRVAASTRVHRGLDGTSERFPPWIRIAVKNFDMTAVPCPGRNGKPHNRFRVNLLIDFFKEEQKTGHGIAWKMGTKDDCVNPVETFVHVKNYETFVNGVEWKHKETTKIWDKIRAAQAAS